MFKQFQSETTSWDRPRLPTEQLCRRAVGHTCEPLVLTVKGLFALLKDTRTEKDQHCDLILRTSLDVSETMQYLKKYLTEGLIQVAILLSLCGLMVDVGLEPYLPASWHERILGPTSALTQAQFHNLRNRLEHGQGLQPKQVDLDTFFTARRLLGWVHSLDRLQVGKCTPNYAFVLGSGKVCFHFQPPC